MLEIGKELDSGWMLFDAIDLRLRLLTVHPRLICLNHAREHNMIRFRDGKPEALWYSQHARGQAFTYKAVEKEGKRVSILANQLG